MVVLKTISIGAITVYRSAIQNVTELVQQIQEFPANLWQSSMIYGKNQKSNIRTSSEMYNPPMNSLSVDFSAVVNDYVIRFNAPKVVHSSAYVLLKYEVGQEFKPHNDDSHQTPRRVSAVGFLNDDYDGGQLSFELTGFVYEPVAGDIVVFPSNFPYMHSSKPIIRGVKYSVVSWWT